MKYRFVEEARRELINAGVSQNCKLVEDLEREVERALNYLCEFPGAAKPMDRIHRSYKLRRFPYLLIYRIAGQELVIVAVAHASREQGYWRRRSSKP